MNHVKKLSQAYKIVPWRSQTQIVTLFTLFLIAIVVVALFLLNVSTRAYQAGYDIQVMQSQIADLELENAAMVADLATLRSMTEMLENAQNLGMVAIDPEEMVYLSVDGYFGPASPVLAPQWREPVSGPDPLPAEYTESVYTWLKRQLAEHPFSINQEGQ